MPVASPGRDVTRNIFAGQLITGFCVSLTVTVNDLLAGLPDKSLAVQVTVVAPFAKTEPDGGVQVGVNGPSQLSLTEAE